MGNHVFLPIGVNKINRTVLGPRVFHWFCEVFGHPPKNKSAPASGPSKHPGGNLSTGSTPHKHTPTPTPSLRSPHTNIDTHEKNIPTHQSHPTCATPQHILVCPIYLVDTDGGFFRFDAVSAPKPFKTKGPHKFAQINRNHVARFSGTSFLPLFSRCF